MMFSRLIVAGFLFASVCAVGEQTPFAQRVDQIAAWLPEKATPDGAPITDRVAWDRLAALPEAGPIITTAVAILGQPVPTAPDELYLEFSQNGNRTHYQERLFPIVTNFSKLVLSECLENKGRFIPKIVDYVDALCALRSWVLPAHDSKLTCFNGVPHIDLKSSEISLQMAFCSAWLGDRLPAATQAKIAAEVDRRQFQPFLATARAKDWRENKNHWWFLGGNNWNSVCNANVVRSALALIADRRLRAEFVAHAERSVPYALAGYTADGYCSEGMGYWNYGYGHLLMMGLSVRAATGGKVDFFADPKTKKVMSYAYAYQIQDGQSPHFADGGGNAGGANLALGRQIWPDLVNTVALKSSVLAGDSLTISLRAFGQEPAPVPPTMDVLPARSWFSDAQVLISRLHHPERTMTFGVAMKGGHNAELHNHNDVGTYYIMLDGCEMGGDPGGEVYTRRTFSGRRYESKVLNSYCHPVPVVAGKLQKGGRTAAARVLETKFTDGRDEITFDLTAAYAVPTLKSLTRTFVFDREKNVFSVTDRVTFTEPSAFEVPVITYRDWTKDAASTVFQFSKGKNWGRKLKMDVVSSAPVSFREEKVENPHRPDVTRLAFTFAEPVTTATFSTVYSSH